MSNPLIPQFVPPPSYKWARYAHMLEDAHEKIIQQMALPTFFDISMVAAPTDRLCMKRLRKTGKTLSGYVDHGRRRRML